MEIHEGVCWGVGAPTLQRHLLVASARVVDGEEERQPSESVRHRGPCPGVQTVAGAPSRPAGVQSWTTRLPPPASASLGAPRGVALSPPSLSLPESDSPVRVLV